MNRVIPVLLALAVSSPFLAIALNTMGVGPGFHVQAPEWESGHQWSYDAAFTGRARGVLLGIAEAETETIRIEGQRSFEVVHDAWVVTGLPYYAGLQSFAITGATYGNEELYNADDGGSARTDLANEAGPFESEVLCLDRCVTALSAYTYETNPVISHSAFTDERSAPEILRLLDFPLTNDKTWTVIAFEEDDLQFEIRAQATEKEYLNLPGLKPMETIRVEAGITDATRSALKTLLQHEAEMEDVTLNLDFDLDFTYWYAPSVEQIVRLDTTAFVAGQGAGYGAAGAFRIDVTFTERLRDYTLTVAENRDPAKMQDIAEGLRASNRAGPAMAPEPFAFTVVADALEMDTTTGQPIRVGLAPADADDKQAANQFIAAPAGSTVTWTQTYPQPHGGLRSDQYEGESIELSSYHPGVHTITAVVTDAQGRLQGIDTLEIDGYQRVLKVIHPDAVPSIIGASSTQQELWIAPRATHAVFEARGDPTTIGTLTVDGPSGPSETGGVDGGRLAYAYPLTGTWHVTWAQQALETRTEVRYEVHYAPEAPADDESDNIASSFDWFRVPALPSGF